MGKKLIVWSEAYSVGIADIDKQHMRLIDLINKLYNLYLEKRHADVIEIVHEIKEYTIYHFSAEEKYFRDMNYIHAREHIALHDDFIQEFNAIVDGALSTPSILTMKIMTFLQKWLTNHIMKEDKKYTSYLK